jgi:hypothetical protein
MKEIILTADGADFHRCFIRKFASICVHLIHLENPATRWWASGFWMYQTLVFLPLGSEIDE